MKLFQCLVACQCTVTDESPSDLNTHTWHTPIIPISGSVAELYNTREKTRGSLVQKKLAADLKLRGRSKKRAVIQKRAKPLNVQSEHHREAHLRRTEKIPHPVRSALYRYIQNRLVLGVE